MKTLSQLKELYSEQGDALYSLALELGGFHERACELLVMANDDYLDAGHIMHGKEGRFLFMKKRLEKYSKKTASSYKRVKMPDSAYDRLFSGARIYIKTGGRVRARIKTLIVVGIMLIVLVVIFMHALKFVYSDEHASMTGEFYTMNASEEE